MRILHTMGALCELLRLGLITRFQFSGAYWTWRLHTAFGRGYPSRREQYSAVLDYARWIFRMRHGC